MDATLADVDGSRKGRMGEGFVASADRYGSGIFDIQERGDRSPRIMLV